MKKILVIEDNNSIRENIIELLELNDFNVHATGNGNEAFGLMQAHDFDLVLCDIHMPQVSGYEVLEQTKSNAKLKSVPFIFISASVQYKEKEQALKMGIEGFLEKPFNEKTLMDTVNKVIGK